MKVEARVDWITQQLRDAFAPEQLEVIDDSHKHIGHTGHQGSGHFTVKIVTPAFAGKNKITRHRLVYDALASEMGPGKAIHALSIQAFCPDEASL